MKRVVFAGFVVAALLRAPEASADDDDEVPRPVLALGAGAATSFVSLTAGAMVIARSTQRAVRNGALLGAQTGLCFSPILAHALVGEMKRGFLFATLPLVAELGMATLMAFYPNFIVRAPPLVQYSFYTFLGTSIVGATVGVLDAARVDERRPARAGLRGLSISAVLDRNMTGAVISGGL